ncbi:MAG TPA: aldo/keto reductase [Acidimicrobiales bacterium]|nr:aldo/keto reductase [Acidimicrobiales bacterium]
MRYRNLGATGMQVSAICLGAMAFGAGNEDPDDCARVVHLALDSGVNFIDTADRYSNSRSEEILGKALVGRRDEVVLASKFGLPAGPGLNERGGSRRWIERAVDASLRRLQTDWLDLYQLHSPDFGTDLDETLGALSDLVHKGKVRAIGASNTPPERIVEGQWVAERRGHVKFRVEQPQYSLFVRGAERSVFPTLERYGMGAIVWSPLNGSWLTGRYRSDDDVRNHSARAKRSPYRFDLAQPGNQAKYALLAELEKIAADAGISVTHLALAFVMTHPAVTAAIVGPRTYEQMADLIAGAPVELDDATLDRLDELVPPGGVVNREDARNPSVGLAEGAVRRRAVGRRAAAEQATAEP